MSKAAPFLVILALALLESGCGNEDSVSLSGSIWSPSLQVEQSAIGTFVSGRFDVTLELGAYAADPVTVESASFTLLEADTRLDLGLPPLDAAPEGASFPLDVTPGRQVDLSFSIEGAEPVSTDAVDTICAAPLILAGTVAHSLNGGGTSTVHSSPFTPDGCP